jgi:hypothetical protein
LAIYDARRGVRSLVRFGAATAVSGVAVLTPFLLADPADVIHSLFTYRRDLVVGAGSVWSLTHGSALEPVVQRWDIVPILAAVIAANAWLMTRPGGLTQGRLFAALALTSASFATFAKTVWPYYFAEAYVFGTVWAFGRWQTNENPMRLVFVPLAIATYALIGEIGSDQGLAANLVALEGGAMFVMVVLTAIWIAWLAAEPPVREAGMAAAAAPLQR